jgi:hypothetical protein
MDEAVVGLIKGTFLEEFIKPTSNVSTVGVSARFPTDHHFECKSKTLSFGPKQKKSKAILVRAVEAYRVVKCQGSHIV